MKQCFRHLARIMILIILLPCTGTAADQNRIYKDAVTFERSGHYEKAESLYVELYNINPDNHNYFTRYKNLLVQQRKFELLLPVLKERVQKRPFDNYLKLELGVLYLALDDLQLAGDTWSDVLKGKSGSVQRSYANGIYQDIMAYGRGSEFYLVVDLLRKETDNPRLLTDQNFAVSLRYRNWDSAVKEILHILETAPADLRYVRTYLFRYDPLSAIYPRAIHALEKTDIREGIELLADIYIHLGESGKAFAVLKERGDDPYLQAAMHDFAERMYTQGDYGLAGKAALWLERRIDDSDGRNPSLAMLATQAYEQMFYDQIEQRHLIPHPYGSKFLTIKYLSFNNEQADMIKAVYETYDSLKHLPGKQGEAAAVRHADITYRIYQDFDTALREYREISKNPGVSSKREVITGISNCYLAKGDNTAAAEFLSSASQAYRLMVHEEDALLTRELYISILSGDVDSLADRTNRVLAMLPMDDPEYNDILAFSGLSGIVFKDSSNYLRWLEAEAYILQNNTASAINIFRSLMDEGSSALKIYALRYLDCVDARRDKNEETYFWDRYFDSLLKTDMADYFMLRYAEFMEKNKKFDISYDIFEKYLLSYQESMYYDTIREYVREHYSLGAP